MDFPQADSSLPNQHPTAQPGTQNLLFLAEDAIGEYLVVVVILSEERLAHQQRYSFDFRRTTTSGYREYFSAMFEGLSKAAQILKTINDPIQISVASLLASSEPSLVLVQSQLLHFQWLRHSLFAAIIYSYAF